MNAREATDTGLFLLQSILQQVVQIPEAPRNKAQASDAEQGVEDLRVDLEPFLGGAIDVAAAWVAHGGRGADEDQEEHTAPGNDVEAVEGDEEAEGRDDEFAECFEADLGGFPGAVFGRELIAIGIRLTRVVRHVRRCRAGVN